MIRPLTVVRRFSISIHRLSSTAWALAADQGNGYLQASLEMMDLFVKVIRAQKDLDVDQIRYIANNILNRVLYGSDR